MSGSGLNNRRTNSKGPVNRAGAFRPKGDAVDELLAMDDATRKAILGDLKRNKPPMQKVGDVEQTGAGGGPRGPEDVGTAELTTVMLGRLNDLERKCGMQRKEMSELNMKLISATDHAAEEKRRRVKAEDELDAAIGELAQVHVFLADYGLNWVGGANQVPTKGSRETSPVNAGTDPINVPSSAPPASSSSKPSFNLYDGGFQAPAYSQGNQAAMGDEQQEVPQPPPGQPTAASIGGARMGARNAGQISKTPAENGAAGGVKLGGGMGRIANLNSLAEPQVPPPPANANATVTLPFDINVLKRQAAKLSEMVGFSGIANDAQKAIIKERDVVHVVVYLDGLCVKGGPFRPYGWAFCDAFLNDLLDGYFPYEYKERYPEGYPIEIVDKSAIVCPKGFGQGGTGAATGATSGASGAGGGGQKLGGAGGAGGGGNNPTTVQSHGDHGYKPLTKDDIMRKLPSQYVTKSGQLINVKEGLSNFVGGSALADAAGKQNFNTTVHGGSTAAAGTGAGTTPASDYPEATATVQVRMPQGQRVVLHMKKENTVGQLRNELLKAASSFFSPTNGFDLCTVLPRRSLTEPNVTLESVGLAPSCSVFVQVKKNA